MDTILVTGGCGFIGSHTCLEILSKGYRILIIDSNINSKENVLEKIKKIAGINSNDERIEFIKGDIRNYSLLNETFKKEKEINNGISAVIHFAALKSVNESNQYPLDYWDINVGGTISLLKVMKDYGCYNFIFSSSATIYGFSEKIILDENSPIQPINTYGRTKSAIEKLLEDLQQSQPNLWRIANLRYFNPIGAHPSGDLGEDPFGMPNNIFPIINKVASKELKHLKIFGNDYETIDGTGVRDYIHVMDVSEGHIVALEYLLKNNPQIINLNLGTGKGTSVLEIISIFEKVNNIKLPYIFTDRREGDVAVCVADNKLAKSLLNWEPKKSLEEMCKDGWKWKQKTLRQEN